MSGQLLVRHVSTTLTSSHTRIACHLIPTVTRLAMTSLSRRAYSTRINPSTSTSTSTSSSTTQSASLYLPRRYYSRTRVPDQVDIGKASAGNASAKVRFTFTKTSLAAQQLDPIQGRASPTAVAPMTQLHIHAIPLEWPDYKSDHKVQLVDTSHDDTKALPSASSTATNTTTTSETATTSASTVPATTSTKPAKIAPPLPPPKTVTIPITSIQRLDKPAPVVVDGLTNGVSYHFTVEAENEVGTSPASYASNEVTPDELWNRIKRVTKHELKHYWHGSKLLWIDMKIASRLVKRVLKGDTLSRRDRRNLVRTTADMLRLIPFAVIVIVPFMEFALPILLKFFPNMLPSVFADKNEKASKYRKQLAVKVEMAQFLQETTQLMASKLLAQKQESESGRRLSLAEFTEFMNKVRSGQSVKNEEILKYCSLFSEEFTLENLSRAQLVAMCKLLNINPFGSDGVLRYKLSRRLDELYKDDQMIATEGVNSLEPDELIDACRARGIFDNSDEAYLRRKLEEWLELSLKSEIPTSLLVLSRAFSAKYQPFHPEVELSEALKHLPEAVVEDTAQNILDRVKPRDTDEHLALQLEALKETSLDDTREPREIAPRLDAPTKTTTTTITPQSKHVEHKHILTEKSTKPAVAEVAPTLMNMKEMIAELRDENKEVAEDFDEVVEVESEKPLVRSLSEPLLASPIPITGCITPTRVTSTTTLTPDAHPGLGLKSKLPLPPTAPGTVTVTMSDAATTPTTTTTSKTASTTATTSKTSKLPIDIKLEQARADALNDKIADLLQRIETEIDHVEKEAPEKETEAAPTTTTTTTTEKKEKKSTSKATSVKSS